MTDQQPPEQQAETPVQQENWEARYKGQQSALQLAVTAKKELETQLATLTSDLEQLRSQLSLKETEKTVAMSERDSNIKSLMEAKNAADQELAKLRALNKKIELAKAMKRPEILPMLDRIPDIDDEEILKQYVTDMLSWADDLVSQREKALLAGVVPSLGGPGTQPIEGPSSPDAWLDKIEKLPLGSADRAKAMDEYYGWLQTKNTK